MKALASPIGAICILDEGTSEYRFINVADHSEIPAETAHLAYGACDDWETVEAADIDALVREVQDRHECLRATANIEVCLIGVSDKLQATILCQVEDYLKTHDARYLKANLLCAPLASITTLKRVIGKCLEDGLASTATLLEDVRELQPHLQRLADRWLGLPNESFATFSGGQQQVWQIAVRSGIVLETMTMATPGAVKAKWGELAFSLRTPKERAGIARIQTMIAQALFPGQTDDSDLAAFIADEHTESAHDKRRDAPKGQNARSSYERAIRQVQAICAAVETGNDANAQRFLQDLIDDQMKFQGGEEYVTKSLCNIATQCAEMFRTDFEYECLQTAVSINTKDGWTRVQLADHYKRVGRFDEAIATLREAAALGATSVARSSLADVYAQSGNFKEAMAIYKAIPGGEQDAAIRTAQADLFRRFGYLDAAAKEYDRIIHDGLNTHRVIAGKAELAKRRGDLTEAHGLYTELLDSTAIEETSLYVYRMAFANVLVRMGEYTEAYKHADDAVQDRPFCRQAKTVRAAIAGILGKPDDAVNDLPVVGQTRAFDEWINDFVRGVLLLMLHRYVDARATLMRKVEEQFADSEGHGLLRLGAAVCLLRNRVGLKEASDVLSRVPEMNDAFCQSLGFDKESELRDWVRSDLQSRLSEEIRRGMAGQVYKYLSDHTNFEVPERLSERQADRILARRMVELYQQGVPPTEVERHLDELRTGAREETARALKLSLIMEALAEKIEVEVTEAEVNGQIAAIAECHHLVLTHFYPVFKNYDIRARVRRHYRGRLTLAKDLTSLQV